MHRRVHIYDSIIIESAPLKYKREIYIYLPCNF